MIKTIQPRKNLEGIYIVPPDKSMSHRAVLFGSLASGSTIVRNFLFSDDCMATINCMRSLGIEIFEDCNEEEILINGKGLSGLQEPVNVMDAMNSGTTIRILSGILAAQPFFSVITGDASLRSRPMKRIIEPLRLMGADISGRSGDRFPPLAISGKKLNAVRYEMPVASAQVKSCILSAALFTEGVTEIVEKTKSRDHTEKYLKAINADVETEGSVIRVTGGRELMSFDVEIPGDVSSAAFLIVAALIVPGSKIKIVGTGLNPTRTGLIDKLIEMEADMEILNKRENSIGEEVGDVVIKTSKLKAVNLTREDVPSLIDEIPLFAIAAAKAHGRTEVTGAEELKVKESNRLEALVKNLRLMGVEIEELEDGFVIEGPQKFEGATIDSKGDHRMAMAFAVAGLAASSPVTIEGAEAVTVSYPDFWDLPFFDGM